MRQFLTIAFAVSAIALLTTCADNDNGPGQFRYPMTVGSEWHYTRTLTRVRDTATFVDYSMQTTIRIGADMQFGMLGAGTEFEITENGENYGAQYYQNRDEGLYSIGHCGFPPVVYPKYSALRAIDRRIELALLAADVISEESCEQVPLAGDQDTPLVLPYPIRVNQDWRYRYVEDLNWDIRKVIRGWSKVTVPAGSFDAYQIDWYYVGGPKLHMVDDICDRGLLRRTLVIDSVQITTPTHPVGTGEYETWIEVLSLDSLKLTSGLD